MPAPEELQQDKDFMTATPADQIKYLSSTDPEFKAAHADDQAAYLAHVTKQPTGAEAMQPKPGITGKLDTATDYISKGLEPVDKAVTEALAPKPTGDVLPTETREVPKAAARNIYGAGKTALKTLTGLPSALGHAFGDEATPEEKAQYSDFEKQHGEKPGTETSGLKRIGLGVGRFLGADQLRSAVDTYSNPATRPTAEQALSVAEPAIQEGAGTVLGMEAAGKIAGVPSRESMPATSDLVDKGVRGMGKAYQAAREVAPEAGAAIGGTVGALKGPGGAAYGMYTGGRVGKILQKITPEGNAAAEFGLSVEDRNVQRLEKAVTTADKAADKAAEDHSIYAASEERGPIDPAVNPAYKKSMEALKKATDAQAEAHFHLQEAKRAAKEAEASKGATEGQGKDITPEEVAAARPETATPTDEELKTRQEKLMGEMEKQAGIEKPAATPENVKLPGQVQPETVPQTLTEAPRVDETTQMRPLAGNKGTIVGRPPRLLGEGTPEAAPAALEAPKTPLGEILPPEKPAKPGRLGTLKAEGGKVVDAETGLQQKLEEGLQGTPKPVALKPLGATEATPLGGKIETTNIPEAPLIAPEDLGLKGSNVRDRVYSPEEKTERTPEDLSKIKKLMADHTDQELLREAKRRGIDESQYDLSKREGPNRHRVDRDKLVNDLVDKIPEDEKDKLVNLSDKFDSKDDSTWTNAEKSNLNRAQRARAIMQEHTGGPKEVSGGSQSADVAGSEESSAKDRAHFAQAKQEFPNGTISEQLLRAQELKEQDAKSEPGTKESWDRLRKTGKTTLDSQPASKPLEGESAEEMARRGVSVEEPLNVSKSANDYNKSQGLSEIKPEKSAKSSRAAEIGQAYDDLKHNPTDEATKKSYDALIDDTKKQWDYATKEMGIKIVSTDEDPYASHEEMMKDLIDNKLLKVYRGGTPLEAGHNLSEVDPNTGENYNTMFRAVHDIFGHAAQGHDFSEAGEESAWNTHRQMMSTEAIPAMTTETRAQTSSYFKNGGKFPDQKSGILPDFAMEKGEPVDHSKAIAELHNEGGGSTYNPHKGDMGGADAYAVPMHPELSRTIEGDKVTPEQIKKYMETPEVKKALASDPTLSVGTWANEGKTYLDLSATIANKEEALKLGREHDQKAITYLKTREDIPTGGAGTGTPLEDMSQKAVKFMTPEEKETSANKGQPEKEGILKKVSRIYSESKLSGEEGKVNVGSKGITKPMPTGDELIKKYGKSDGDPAHTAFILPDGRGVAQIGTIHDEMLGGKATDKLPRREQFTQAGNIRMRSYGAYGDRQFSLSLPESGITTDQLNVIKKMTPQMGTGRVYVEIGKPGGAFKEIEYGKASDELEKTIKDMVPVKSTLPELAEKHLTPEERQGVTKSPQQQERFIQRMESMPELQEWKDAAQKGAGERKWYQRSSQAFDAMSKEAPEYFDQPGDRDKFVGMLAAGSPQQSVAMNMREALKVWTSYVDNGRPTGPKLEKLLSKPSDQGGFTLPGAKIPNAMKALAGESLWPDITKNKNFKVPSFRDNLTGVLDRVTNDGWMALFSGLDAKDVSSAHSYHPISVMTRAAAEELGWKPAEAQAAVWAFIKTLTEKGVDASEDPHEMRQYSEDFSDIILHDPETRNLLKEMGVDHAKLDERLAREVERKPKPESGSTSPTGEDSSRRAVERVEAARGKGTIPAAKTGLLKFGEPEPDEATSFKTEDLKSGDNPVKDHTYEYTESGTLKSVTARDAEGNSVATVVATPEESDPNTWTVGFSKATETGKGIGLGAYAKLAEEAKAEAQRTGQAITLQGDKPDQMSAAARRTWVKLGEQGYDVQWAKDNRPSIVLRGSGLKKLGSSEKTTALGKIQK